MVLRRALAVLATIVVLGLAPPSRAADRELTPEQRVEIERIRPTVEAVLAQLNDPDGSMTASERFHWSITELAAVGPAVGPFMLAELELPSVHTFNIACYVTGLVDPPGGVEALRRAYDVADQEAGPYAQARKQWTVYGLALAGDPSAVSRAASGSTPVDWVEFMEGMRLIELAAVLTAPRSVPILEARLETPSEDEESDHRFDFAVLALGRVGDPSSVSRLVALLDHPRARTRAYAARALGRIGDGKSAPDLVEALSDPAAEVRVEAAFALYRVPPRNSFKKILAALESSNDLAVRRWLYRAVAQVGGESALDALRNHAGRRDYVDRASLLAAIGETGNRKALNLLRSTLDESDSVVVLAAVRALDAIGGEGATDSLIALISDARWPVAQTAIEILFEKGETKAAPRIADRLIDRTLAQGALGPLDRSAVRLMCEALVGLRYTERTKELAKAVERQTDIEIVGSVKNAVRDLEAIETHGVDVDAWKGLLRSDDAAMRRLAARRLGDIGSDGAVAALAQAFDPGREEDALEIVRAAASAGSSAARGFLGRVLEDERFDTADPSEVRAWAAWGLRRIGGDESVSRLRRSVLRRDGQDWPVVLYLAQAAGRDAIATLAEVRAKRLRHYTWLRGAEQDQFDEILVSLREGRSIRSFDVRPTALHLH